MYFKVSMRTNPKTDRYSGYYRLVDANLKKDSFCILKTKGNYHCIYNETNFLNIDLVTEVPYLFSSFFMDLRDIKSGTKIEMDKSGEIKFCENLQNGNHDSDK